eukprot:1545174-Amphidinium_carterae.1
MRNQSPCQQGERRCAPHPCELQTAIQLCTLRGSVLRTAPARPIHKRGRLSAHDLTLRMLSAS